MQPDSDLCSISFEVPSSRPWCFGLNPYVAGYRNHVAWYRALCYALGATAVFLGVILSLTQQIPVGTGMAMVAISLVAISVVRWTSIHTEFCPLCGARTKSAWNLQKQAWCSGCYHLNDPRQVLVDEPNVLDLSGPENLRHDDPIPRTVATTLLFAFHAGAHEVRFEYDRVGYNIKLEIGDETRILEPPPLFIHFAVTQTVKAIAGLDLCNCTGFQEGPIEIRVRDQKIPANVIVQPTELGDTIVFRWPVGPITSIPSGHGS